eukprot:TCALIF_04083-PB protein Name:"Protein of unknown function" AED:0.12 eAED:0.12 QI:0/0.75/0.8/0.8/0.5/0.6/5/2991/66
MGRTQFVGQSLSLKPPTNPFSFFYLLFVLLRIWNNPIVPQWNLDPGKHSLSAPTPCPCWRIKTSSP